MTPLPLLVIGDCMLDRDVCGSVERICPEAPVPVLDEQSGASFAGGAGRAATIAADSSDVTLITALGDDEAGDACRQLLERSGVRVLDLGLDGATPEKIRMRSDGRTLLRLDRAGAPSRATVGDLLDRHRDAVRDATVVVASDYGRGVASHPQLRQAIAERAADVPVVWDPHPRGRPPIPGVALATPNRREAADTVPDVRGTTIRADAARARELRERWQARAIALTLGEAGALLEQGAAVPVMVPAPTRAHGDPCGAGDCFAVSAAIRLADGATAVESVTSAVAAATRYVAGERRSAAAIPGRQGGSLEHARAIAERVRAEGGTVVATGGCFDLLHAGHIATLESARRLGDCLLVLLNSDRSVEALKGPDRPLVQQDDRARLLESLRCVDAVVIFDDPDPTALLEQLQPHLFAKGGDYAGEALPETAVMRRFAGQTVILPTLEGRSTTRLIERALASEAPR
jgi:rfaE bifunctional protein nucleotidyltransferase chain/domain/rfaE bifunctional protein kinase chain/domain